MCLLYTQYDEPAPLSTSFVAAKEADGKASSKSKSNSAVKWGRVEDPNRDKQLEEISRANALTRADEEDQAFWEDMRNTNREQRSARPKSQTWGQYNNDDNDDDDDGNEGTYTRSAVPPGSVFKPQQQKQSSMRQKKDQSSTAPGTDKSHGSAAVAGGGGSKRSQGGAVVSTSTAREPSAKGASAGSSVPGGPPAGSGPRKFRTKTFDRHHQKDKSLRKTGGL